MATRRFRLVAALAMAVAVVVSCGDDDEADVLPTSVSTVTEPSNDSMSASSAQSGPAASSSATTSAQPSPATSTSGNDASSWSTVAGESVADESAAVIAAAVLDRVADQQPPFTTFHVVEHLGESDESGMVFGLDEGRVLTTAEREAIEAVLAPNVVRFVESLEAVVGDELSIAEKQAVIMIAAPSIDGSDAMVATNLWCGGLCGVGSIAILERTGDGAWTVVGEEGGYVA